MACFIAPLTEAVVVTAVKKTIEKKEKNKSKIQTDNIETDIVSVEKNNTEIPFSKKIGWLSNMLWGGSFLLLIEHIWHGEVVPWPPFLTAMGSPEDTIEMLKEIATVGTCMAALVTLVWVVMVAVVYVKENALSVEKE